MSKIMENIEIELRVKSGPGDIVGINTIITNDKGIADFSGIQFNEPGIYVIQAIDKSGTIKSDEITINVLPTEDFIPQETDEDESVPIVGERPFIAQIDSPSIKLDPIEFSITNNTNDDGEIGGNIGHMPFLWYFGAQIDPRYIYQLILYSNGILPMLKVKMADPFSLLSAPTTTPLNNSTIELFLNSGSSLLKSIHLRFRISTNQQNKDGTYTIIGELDIDNFYRDGFNAYEGTSFTAIRKIVKEFGLGFNSNITDTNDSMIWRRNGINSKDFINSVIRHSYISDSSFMVGYIDYYWSFNYVDVEKEWNRDNSGDIGAISTGITGLNNGYNNNDFSRLILTTDKSVNSSPFYITNILKKNNSTNITNNAGIFTLSNVYDRQNKRFLKYDIDSLSSDPNRNVILKGSPLDSKEISENFRTSYKGKLDIDNVHDNYYYAPDQNHRNLLNLSNVSITADLPQPNYNLYRFQKIKIIFTTERVTSIEAKPINERLSGDWIISNISFIWDGGSFFQRIQAFRKELGKLEDEINNQTVNDGVDVDNREINENGTEPELNPPLPNQEWELGTEYTVVDDSDGTIYLFLVKELSDDGIGVKGDLRRADGGIIENN
jgi:hypothetical protein